MEHKPFPNPMSTELELIQLLMEAGFQSIEIVSDRLDHLYVNFDHRIECLWRRATRHTLEKLSPRQFDLLKQRLNEELDSQNRPDGFHEEFHVFYTMASISEYEQ